MNNNEGNYQGAWLQSLRDRDRFGSQAQPYANVEHGLFSSYMNEQIPGSAYFGMPLLAPGYQAYKALEHLVSPIFGVTPQSTPPSWEQLWWGLRPLWGRN